MDFGKYGSIAAKGGLYLAQDGNTKEYSLITGDGKYAVGNKNGEPVTDFKYLKNLLIFEMFWK